MSKKQIDVYRTAMYLRLSQGDEILMDGKSRRVTVFPTRSFCWKDLLLLMMI